MNISQISANARSIFNDVAVRMMQGAGAQIESIYTYLVATHRDNVVQTLIRNAMMGRSECYINFDRSKFSCGIGRPSDVLRETLIRIINSDARLVGVKISVWNNAKNTVHFKWT